jgi:uncharacterized membrane protein YkoI
MRAVHLWIAVLFGLLPACLSHQEKLTKQALVSMPQAVSTAEASVPGGKAMDSHLESQNGRPVYEIKIADTGNNTRTVWVDGETGRITKNDR